MKNKRPVTFFKYLLIILLSIVMLVPSPVQAAATERSEGRTIRVAFPVQEGMSYFHDDGTPDGYSCTYLGKIAEYTGWKIEYVPYDSGDENC